MSLSRNRLVWALPALALFASGCGDDTTTSPTGTDGTTTGTTTTGTVTATVTPASPIGAGVSADGNFRWSGAFVVTLVNTNTSPVTISTIAADLQQSSGGILITPIPDTDESFRFEVRAPFNRIDVAGSAGQSIAIPFTFFYTLPNGGRESTVTIKFATTTDAGASETVTSTVILQ